MSKKSLPDKRIGYTQKMRLGGQTLYLHTGEYKDGSLGEIFVDLSKEGALIRSLLNCICITVSVALQNGTPLEDLVDKFLHTKFDPSGPVQCHAHIKMASSITDLIFRDLAINYLGRDDLKHVKGEEI
jgi:ribonucleoside-diphosphate reductase alpha chain